MISAETIDAPITPDANSSYRLYQAGVTGLILIIGLGIWIDGGSFSLKFLLALCILVLSALPALLWAKLGRAWFPAFEITLLSTIAFYAAPLIGQHPELAQYPDAVIHEASFLVIAYLLCANVAFLGRAQLSRAPTWATVPLIPEALLRYLPLGVILNTVYLYISYFQNIIPYNLAGSLRALFFGLGMISTFVMCRLLGLGLLSRPMTGLFIVNFIIQLLIQFSQLYLIGGISILALALIAYASAKRTIPWLPILLMLPVLGVLHAGKSQMRNLYWEEQQPMPQLSGLPAFFAQWIDFGLHAQKEDLSGQSRTTVFERASLIQMLCLSVDRIPEVRPYLNGESYVDIPAQVIPRFVWPDKPSSLLANVRLAVHFNLVDPDDAFKVSIAFGIIAEAFCNFGFIGPPVLGFLIGFCFKYISNLAQNAPQFSALGLFMILLTAWSFQVEQVMATWLSSLFQAAVVCIGAPLVYRKFYTG